MNKCVICGAADLRPKYKDMLECAVCGHTRYAGNLEDNKIIGLYGREYFFGGEYSNYIADRKMIEKNFKLRLKVLERYLSRSHHKRLLEIGSAFGFFLNTARSYFNTVVGIDVCPEGVCYSKEIFGLDVIDGDFLKYDFGNRKFDVVCLWDTIEHLKDPQLYVEKIANCTEGGSLLAITTGDVESFVARFEKRKWRLMHPPTHLHYFSNRSLIKLLQDKGFEIIYNRYCGFYRTFDLALYRIFALGKGKKNIYDFLSKTGFSDLGFYLNLYDIRYVIAKKMQGAQ